MDKSDFCQQLIDDIKDDVLLDSDIMALESLLLFLLENDVERSFNNWKYLILKYDIKSLNNDLDFQRLVKNFPEKLMEKVGIESFFNYMEKLPHLKSQIVYKSIFNIYSSECFIYRSLDCYIKKNCKSLEKDLINTILDKSSVFSKLFFDKAELIKRVIVLHIENSSVPIDYLKELIDIVDNKKEQAVLKALLIDYFTF